MNSSGRSRGRSRRKILFLITEDWYFLSHRLPIARECRRLGWDVVVATRVGEGGAAIEREGFRVAPIRLRRSGRNPLSELRAIVELVAILFRERPDIVHQVGMKPVLYGSLAAMLARPSVVVSALAGMGYVFTAGSRGPGIARAAMKIALRACLGPSNRWLIVQNDDDAAAILGWRLIDAGRLVVIRGSGVDMARFGPTPEPDGEIVAAVVSRMLRDKGIGELVSAARELKRRGAPVRIRLVGAPDPDNPSSLDRATLEGWVREGCVEWLGHRDDVAEVWAAAHIAVLPSYREGLPKTLLEAAACGRPIVATDVPGCRDAVDHDRTGLLVPVRDAAALADAIATLADSPELRARMGAAGRAKAAAEFSDRLVVGRTLDLYRRALEGAGQGDAGLAPPPDTP